MIPIFQIFDKTISAYMILATVGALVVLFVSYKLALHHGLDEIQMLYATLFSFIGVGVGGALLYGLTNWELLIDFLSNLDKLGSFREFFDGIMQIFGGSVFYGGLLGMLLVVRMYVRRNRLSMRYYDVAAISIPLFHFFGRMGCFLSGCCFGMECSFGFVYRYSLIPQANGVRRFPVQLFEAVFNLALVWVLYRFFRKKKYEGYLLNIYLYAYPIFRFLDEFLRGDDYRGIWHGLSTSQWISLFLLLGNTIYLLCKSKKQPNPKTDVI